MIHEVENKLGLPVEMFSFQEKVCHTMYEHYQKRGGFTSTAAAFIKKLISAQWEKDEYIMDLENQDKNAVTVKLQKTIDQRDKEIRELKAKIEKLK